MAYMFVLDERSDGLRFFQAGQLDLRDSHFEFLGVYGRLAPNQYAYGELTAANGQFGRDVDIFDFGILAPGRYRVTVDNYTWDFLNFDFLSISQITLQDEFFRTIDTRFFAPSSIDFVVQEASRYFLELTGPFGGNAQYRLTYSKTGELIAPNNPAVFAETASIFGELVPGSIISASVQYFDPDGNSNGIVLSGWYLDGELISFGAEFEILDEHVGREVSVDFFFNDDRGNLEVSPRYFAGVVEAVIDQEPAPQSEPDPEPGLSTLLVMAVDRAGMKLQADEGRVAKVVEI